MKETLYTSLVAAGTAAITSLLGGWDLALEILLIVVAMDYITGTFAAYKMKTLHSSVGFEGLFKKGSIFLVVILAAQIDRLTGNNFSMFRTTTCFFFVANDGLSILENVGEMGVKLPKFIGQALIILRDQNSELPEETGEEEVKHDAKNKPGAR